MKTKLFYVLVIMLVAMSINAKVFSADEPQAAEAVPAEETVTATQSQPAYDMSQPVAQPMRQSPMRFILAIIIFAALAVPYYIILNRIGFSIAAKIIYVILLPIPFINILAVWLVATSHWPAMPEKD